MKTDCRRWIVWMCIACLLAGCGSGEDGGGNESANTEDRAFQPLEFPFQNPGDIVRMAAFGIPNWSGTEPHNGIDLQVSDALVSSRLVSPAAGEVAAVTAGENPYSNPAGQLMVTVSIRINNEWQVNLVMEPSSAEPALKTAQLAAVLVREGDTVEAGTPVADLMVGTLGYPHLHYMVEHNMEPVCAYEHSSPSARAVFESIARLPNNNLPDGNICHAE